MRKLRLIVLLILSFCKSYPDFQYKYEVIHQPDGRVKISYRNGETFLGRLDKNGNPDRGIVFDTETGERLGGINFQKNRKFIGKPDWCKSGDCYNGVGVSIVELNQAQKIYQPVTRSSFYFQGYFDDYNEENGSVYLLENPDYALKANLKDSNEFKDKEVFIVKDGVWTATSLLIKIKKESDENQLKLELDRREREKESRKRESERIESLSKIYDKLLNQCNALSDMCRTDYRITYIDHNMISEGRDCWVNDYNKGNIRQERVLNVIRVRYYCTVRGQTVSRETLSDIYINTKTGRCGLESNDACR